jgi:hypothetical protein
MRQHFMSSISAIKASFCGLTLHGLALAPAAGFGTMAALD